MELSPTLYHTLIRPKWITKRYIHDKIAKHFTLHDKMVLDFGAGTGANCILCKDSHYLGIDPDAKRIQFAKQLNPGYQFDVLQGDSIPTDNDSVDVVLIVAVLHHIPPEQVEVYMQEFRRILRNTGGRVVVMEPCFFEKTRFSNWFMHKNDNGKYIQTEDGYLNYFRKHGFTCEVLNRYKKCFLYNELLFSAH